MVTWLALKEFLSGKGLYILLVVVGGIIVSYVWNDYQTAKRDVTILRQNQTVLLQSIESMKQTLETNDTLQRQTLDVLSTLSKINKQNNEDLLTGIQEIKNADAVDKQNGVKCTLPGSLSATLKRMQQ